MLVGNKDSRAGALPLGRDLSGRPLAPSFLPMSGSASGVEVGAGAVGPVYFLGSGSPLSLGRGEFFSSAPGTSCPHSCSLTPSV